LRHISGGRGEKSGGMSDWRLPHPGSPAISMQRFRWIANLRNDSIGRHRLVNPHRFSREIGSVR